MKKILISLILLSTSGCALSVNTVYNAYQIQNTKICYYSNYSADENSIIRTNHKFDCKYADQESLTVLNDKHDELYNGEQRINKVATVDVAVTTDSLSSGEHFISSIEETTNYDLEINQSGEFYSPSRELCYEMKQSRKDYFSKEIIIDCPK